MTFLTWRMFISETPTKSSSSKAASKKPLELTIDNKCVTLALGKVRALAEGLAGHSQSVLFPRDPVGHVGHGRRPAVAALRAESERGGSGRGQTGLSL